MLTELIFQCRGKLQVFISFAKCQQSVSKASPKRHLSVCVSVSKALVQASSKCSCKHWISIIYLQTGAVEGTASWHSILHSILAQYLAQYSAQFGTVWHSLAQYSLAAACGFSVCYIITSEETYIIMQLLFSATMLLRSLFRSERFLRYLSQE